MIGKTLGNRYEIVEKIGGGGMALVYKAKCTLLNRYVAVKILRAEFTNDKDIIDKFKKESQAAASLSHPNIVNLYDVGEENEIYYIVMEYVKGKTLKEVIKEKDILSLEEIIHYTKQIALALQHAHYNHVIHRDIKPHNILITEDSRAKVTDFGIALAATSSTITNMGSVIGSVHYFSPEQARGGYTDEKSDLYSLGIVMYEMATGKVPFEGDSPIAIALKHIQQEPVVPSELNPQISKGLEEIILTLIQKDQLSRYQNAQDLIEDVDKLKNDPSNNTLMNNINHEDSPTQIIPRIKEEDIKEMRKNPKKIKKRNNKVIVISAVMAALIAAGLFTFGLFYLSNFFRTGEVEVPNLLGMTIEDARVKAIEMDLRLTEEQTASNEVPANEIMDQNPSAGMKVRPGYSIIVKISSGPRQVEVPDLVYEDAANAPFILENQGLIAGVPSYEFSEFPNGVIIRQDPRAGTSTTQGSTVDYVISQGPEVVTFPMPNLVGFSIENAKNIIQDHGLQEGRVSEVDNDEHAKGIVIEQNFEAGTPVRENAIIDLVVSRGPQEVLEEETEIDVEIDDEEAEETSANNLTTKTVEIRLRGHEGIVNIEIKSIPDGGTIINTQHNIDQRGEIVEISLTGTGVKEYELFINNEKVDTIRIDFRR
ncbi:serine/threonine protein kinase [Natronincola peptidivorans]|uniref:non-specific serine/threonine protein kinase n=1 Tax=Natronincola peptidivorans TaxID=426128 RepID=A0A1H9YB77_9FIRM|nr:serine/threonine protein kinase [Natronincola peptidivorans]